MAGSKPKFRHLSRTSSHRISLLRNLVTALLEHESIVTTYAKAKEAQRYAEKLITLAKRNTNAAKNKAQGIVRRPNEIMPKLFGPIRKRYDSRPGGYTRVLHIEPEKEDQAQSAILELVDGPKDMRFAMTAKAIAREQELGKTTRRGTASNMEKVLKFRGQHGKKQLENMVAEIRKNVMDENIRQELPVKKEVYPKRDSPQYEQVSMLKRR